MVPLLTHGLVVVGAGKPAGSLPQKVGGKRRVVFAG